MTDAPLTKDRLITRAAILFFGWGAFTMLVMVIEAASGAEPFITVGAVVVLAFLGCVVVVLVGVAMWNEEQQ